MAKNITADKRNEILRLYKMGVSSAEIARQLGVAKSTVTRNTLKAELREKQDTGKRLSQAVIEEMKSMYTNTLLPKKELAERLSVSIDSINFHTRNITERKIPAPVIKSLITHYLQGEMTPDAIKKMTGITKTHFYNIVREETQNV
ncbi:helix-turn-helix domain-containing protein [Bacillus sp. NPDC077027]|uniref:helix-turn-helix domain-containing protein n=1 Tax=Bacillus sp. NPDC077027 TaxID=3390548 RepID=UPI003D082F80